MVYSTYMEFINDYSKNIVTSDEMTYVFNQFLWFYGFDARNYDALYKGYGTFDPNKMTIYRKYYFGMRINKGYNKNKASTEFIKRFGFNIEDHEAVTNSNLPKNQRIIFSSDMYGKFDKGLIDDYNNFITDLTSEFDNEADRENNFKWYFGISMDFNLLNGLEGIENIIYYKFEQIKSISQLKNE